MDNSFIIPPSPNWFNSNILACAPDNTLIFGTKNDVLIVHPTTKNESLKIEILPDEGSNQKVVCVDVTPKWNSPNKWILCSWEDNVIKMWDMKKQEWKKCSVSSKGDRLNLVGARFLSEDRMLSVTESGTISLCHLPQMKFTPLSNIFQTKVTVTCFAPCPHSPHIVALGLKQGLITVVDLRKNGTLMHKLRGHTGDVISLSWCPSPVNIFPQKPGNRLQGINNNKIESHVISEENDNLDNSNSLIEKIENLIIEAETKPTEGPSVDLSNSEEVQIAEKNSLEVESIVKKPEEELLLSPSEKVENNKICESTEVEEEVLKESVPCEVKEESSGIVEPIMKEQNEELSSIAVKSPENISSKIEQPLVEEPKREYLLASSAKDGYIYIWRAKSDGRMQCFFKINEKRSQNNKKKSMTGNSWFATKWISPFSLLIGTKKGEIRKYILPKPLDGKKEYTLVHNEHSTFIFTIAAYVPILTEENWFVENKVTIWTFGYDMYLLNTILDSAATHIASIEMFCSPINCMAYSPVDPNRIALGLSNGTIKVWNANNSSPKCFSTANYAPKIYSRITCLEWHPTNELIIAFGTEEGTIGFLNTNNKQKATWFKQYFSNTIHNIQWAPYADKICLYAIGNGTLVCFDPDKPKEEPIKIDVSADDKFYYFSWKCDMSMMLLSTTSGKLSFYDSSLALKASYYNNKKLSLINWHPDSKTMTSRSFWVAMALENVVYIFDFAEIMEKTGTLNIENVLKTKISVHFAAVRSLAWNLFVGDQLVSAGDDGLAYILDVPSGTVLSSYYDPRFQPIRSIIWSPVEENLLIMAMSKPAILMGWKSDDHKGPLSSEILRECENRSKNSKKTNVALQKDEDSDKKAKKVMKTAKNVLLPSMKNGTEEMLEILRETIEEPEIKDPKKNFQMAELFGSKNDVLSLLNKSEKIHSDNGKLEAATTVSGFKGDLQSHITEAIEQYRVNPLLISLAPSVSISLWQKACETYAVQLSRQPDAEPLEVALFYLACQNIERAIEYLCEKDLYKEALTLAKSRLPEDSVIIEGIIKKWAQYSSFCGNLETGALCYIKLGNYEEASKLLFRRCDGKILDLALKLANKTENEALVKAIGFRLEKYAENGEKGSEETNTTEGGESTAISTNSDLMDNSIIPIIPKADSEVLMEGTLEESEFSFAHKMDIKDIVEIRGEEIPDVDMLMNDVDQVQTMFGSVLGTFLEVVETNGNSS